MSDSAKSIRARVNRSYKASPELASGDPPYPKESEADEWIESIRPLLRLAFEAGLKRKEASQETQVKRILVSKSSPPIPDNSELELEHEKHYIATSPLLTEVSTIKTPEEGRRLLAQDVMPRSWRYVIHSRGEAPCYGQALVVTRLLQSTEPVNLDLIRHIDGYPISSGEVSRCDFCGFVLEQVFSKEDLDWDAHILKVPNIQTAVFVEPPGEPTEENQGEPEEDQDTSRLGPVIDSLLHEPVLAGAVLTPNINYPFDEVDDDTLKQLTIDLGLAPYPEGPESASHETTQDT